MGAVTAGVGAGEGAAGGEYVFADDDDAGVRGGLGDGMVAIGPDGSWRSMRRPRRFTSGRLVVVFLEGNWGALRVRLGRADTAVAWMCTYLSSAFRRLRSAMYAWMTRGSRTVSMRITLSPSGRVTCGMPSMSKGWHSREHSEHIVLSSSIHPAEQSALLRATPLPPLPLPLLSRSFPCPAPVLPRSCPAQLLPRSWPCPASALSRSCLALPRSLPYLALDTQDLLAALEVGEPI